jgi:hemoglobin
MSEMPSPQHLYESVGGSAGVESLVAAFYQRVLADAELAGYFINTSVHALRHMQHEFFTAALGGPVAYRGRPIAHVHQSLSIPRPHFQRFVEHLLATLKGLSLSEQDRYDIIARINTYADEVIGEGTESWD